MKAYSEDLRAEILEAVDRGMPKSEATRTFGVSRSSVKRYVASRREGRPLAPNKHPGSKPKLDGRARKLLEADVEGRPATTLKDRCRFLEGMVGVSVSESTLSRLLGKMGFGLKDGAWARARGTSSWGLPGVPWYPGGIGREALRVRGRVLYQHLALADLWVVSRDSRVCFEAPRN